MRVTSSPRCRADAAASEPIQPAPITTRRPPAVEALADRVGLSTRAQVEDALEVGARESQPAGLGAGREQQPVEGQPLAAVQRDLADRRRRWSPRRVAEPQLDLVLVVERRVVVHVDLLALGLAAQVLLGQRRPLVRALGLGADEHERPSKPSSRRVSAALAPARLAPTITNVPAMVVSPSCACLA